MGSAGLAQNNDSFTYSEDFVKAVRGIQGTGEAPKQQTGRCRAVAHPSASSYADLMRFGEMRLNNIQSADIHTPSDEATCSLGRSTYKSLNYITRRRRRQRR